MVESKALTRNHSMSEQPDSLPKSAPENAESGAVPSQTISSAPGRNPLVSFFSRLNLTQLTLAVLVLIFLWQWIDEHYQINQVQQELAKRLTEMDGENKANQTLLTQNQEVVRELGGKLSLLESKYADSQNQRAALETLYQEMSSSRDQTALADVEQMLMIAGQQLQLSANIKAALIAMQQADNRLQRLDRPALNGLRKSINHDIDKLRALPNIDVAGINLRIDNLVASIDTLPLSQDIRKQVEQAVPAAVKEENVWAKFWRELWQEAKQLVRIENTEKHELPLLSPTQTFFLRENLKIRLLSARLSLLSHDEASFKRDLKSAQEWISLYFDTRSNDGSQALLSLQKLEASNINIDLPDITGSLEAVRNFRISLEKGAR
jgi:uroporphyrin-3 C-methyltransferase